MLRSIVMSKPSDHLSTPQAKEFLKQIVNMRQFISQGRKLLPPHAVFKPDYDLHDRRLNEIERLFRAGGEQNLAQIPDLQETFMLDLNADTATVMSEAQERLVRFTDQLAQKFEEKKYELPSEVRDGLEDLLQPYHDGIRDQMLDTLPIETRRDIEAAKRAGEDQD